MSEEILLQAAQCVPQESEIVLSVPITPVAGTLRSLNLNTNKTHNNVDIIGLAVRVADSNDNSYSSLGNKLINLAILNCAKLEIWDGVKAVLESIPLAMLVPPAGCVYVPVIIKNFNPGTSKILFNSPLLTTTEVRDIEISLIRSN